MKKYVSYDFQKSTVVCDKLECIHNDDSVENLEDYFECNAYVGVGANFHIYYISTLQTHHGRQTVWCTPSTR